MEFHLLTLQLETAEASLAERSSHETSRENELQQRCRKYEQFADQYRTQRVSSVFQPASATVSVNLTL